MIRWQRVWEICLPAVFFELEDEENHEGRGKMQIAREGFENEGAVFEGEGQTLFCLVHSVVLYNCEVWFIGKAEKKARQMCPCEYKSLKHWAVR